MELLSISLGEPRQIEYNNRWVSTGIYKQPVPRAVGVTALGLAGDVQVDRENHGGRDKAIYVYTVENYRFWQEELGEESFPHGQFGENFTVSGMEDGDVHLGDVFQIGEIVVEVTQPRVPCFKLGVKMGDPRFVEAFLRSGRAGFYLRVLREGAVRAGDGITRVREDAAKLNIRDCMSAIIKGPRQREIIERALAVEALSEAWRKDLQKRLRRFDSDC
jgi:MOSC domain-containing protein YiiM